MQEWVTDHLEPSPEIEFRTFRDGDAAFGVLVVSPVDLPPAMVKRDLYDDNNNLHLHKGRFHIRRGSGKKTGSHDDLERILENRIDARRNEILDGVEKAIHLGPEFVEQLSSFTDTAGIEISASDDAELQFKQRLSRDPASTLDQELNEDIARTVYRDDDYAEAVPTWRYYAGPSSLTLDHQACEYLYNCGLKNKVLGVLWLSELPEEEAVHVISEIPNSRSRGDKAAEIALLRGSGDLLTEIENTMMYGESRKTRTYREKLGRTLNHRFRYLSNSAEHSLGYDGWSDFFTPEELDEQECREKIHAIADQLVDIEDTLEEEPGIRGVRNNFRDAIHDLELQLGKEVWELAES